MSKKALLEEGTIRRFMKLAGTQPLSNTFVENSLTAGESYSDDDETTNEGLFMEDDIEGALDSVLEEAEEELEELEQVPVEGGVEELDVDVDVEDEGGDEEFDVELDAEEEFDVGDEEEGEPLDDAMEQIKDLVSGAVTDALESAIEAGELQITVGEPEEEIAAAEFEGDAGDEGDELDVDVGVSEEPGPDEMVAEIARRVAKRLLKR